MGPHVNVGFLCLNVVAVVTDIQADSEAARRPMQA